MYITLVHLSTLLCPREGLASGNWERGRKLVGGISFSKQSKRALYPHHIWFLYRVKERKLIGFLAPNGERKKKEGAVLES